MSDEFAVSQGVGVSPLTRFPSIQNESSQVRIPTTESPAPSSALANSLVDQSKDSGPSVQTPKPNIRAQFDLKPLGDRFKFLDKIKAPYEVPKPKPKASPQTSLFFQSEPTPIKNTECQLVQSEPSQSAESALMNHPPPTEEQPSKPKQ